MQYHSHRPAHCEEQFFGVQGPFLKSNVTGDRTDPGEHENWPVGDIDALWHGC